MFVIKHFTKISQCLAARHIKHMSRFSQVSANVSTFNTDAIVSGRSFGPGSNSLLWITLDQYQGEAEMWNIDLFCVCQNSILLFNLTFTKKLEQHISVLETLRSVCKLGVGCMARRKVFKMLLLSYFILFGCLTVHWCLLLNTS